MRSREVLDVQRGSNATIADLAEYMAGITGVRSSACTNCSLILTLRELNEHIMVKYYAYVHAGCCWRSNCSW